MDKKKIAVLVLTILLGVGGAIFGGDIKSEVCGNQNQNEQAK